MRADDFLELDAPKTQSADAFLDAESFLDDGLDTPEPDTRDLSGLADVARFDRRGPEPGAIRQPRNDDEPQFGDYLGATPGMIAEGLGGAVGGTMEGFGLIADRAQRVTADNKVTIALDNLRKAGENLARAQEFPEYRNRDQIIGKAQEEFEQRQQQLHEATVALAEQKPSEAAQFLRELGVDIQELGRSMGPGDDLQGVYRDLTTGLGSMLAYYGPGLVAGAVTRGSGLASLGTAAAMAGPAGVSEQYARAKQSGLSEDEALAVAMKGIPGGVVQVAPIAALIRPLPAEIQGKAIGQLYGILRAAGSEFVAENAGAIMQNLVEQSYNPEKGTWDDTPYQGLIAGGSSAILQTAIQLVTKGRGMNASGTQTGRVQEAQPAAEQPGAVEPEQAAPETEQPEPATKTGDWTDALLAEEFLDAPVQPEVAQQGIDATPEEGFGLNPFEQAPAQPEAAQTEQVEQAPVETESLTERGTGVFRVPVDQIQVDPEQYQFRSRVNEQGVDQRLSGVEQWDDNRAGSVLLHRRNDGSLYVADGHHRVDLARRLGQGEINARVIDEADGFDVSDARVEAAMNNIADGKAEPLDVAKVFRDSGIPVEQVRRRYDLPNNQVARDGEALAKLTDNVFGLVSSGQLSEKDGAAIGNAFTESGQQEAAAGTFQRIEPSTDYQRQLLINELRAAEFAETQGEQGGLFGDDAQEISLMQQRLQVLDALRQRLNSDKRLFKSLNDNADRASEAGNRIATEANESITQESARTLDLIGRVTTTPALNEMVNRAARRVYDGENRAAVVTQLKQELMAYERGQAQPDSGRPSPAQSSQPANESGDERRTGERVPEQDAREADQGGQPESGQQEVTPALDLETQTEEQLAEQARAREEAQQAEARQKREEEQRATADEQVDGFTLTGSDRTADVAMAAGQDDMFVAGQTAQKVEQAAAEVDQNPTESQIEAGNYKKGHVTVQGLDITLENPRGSTRSGTDPDGNEWSVTMAHHYGYLKRTEGADGEHVDVFVGPDLDSDAVFIVDQVNPDGSFDEHKVLLAFKNQVQARKGYKDNYTKDWKVGPITRMTMDEFKAWLAEGDLTKPLKLEKTKRAAKEGLAGVTLVREHDGVPYYRVSEDQIALDFDAEPSNDGQAGNLPSGQRGASDAAAEAADAGRRAPRIQSQRQRARQVERQSFLHGLREVTSASEAAHVLAPFRKDAHETMLGLVLDGDRKPLAIIRHSKGTIDGAAVYPEQFVSDVVSVPGADSVWLSHNHPSGRMEPSQADLKITQTLGPMIKNANLKLEGHVIIGFGRDHTAFDVSDRSDGGMSVTAAAVRKHRIPVLERQLASKSGMKDATPIKDPKGAVSALKEMADKNQTGVMLLDNAHRPLGFLDLSGYDLGALRGAGAYRDVLQALATTNANAGIIQAGVGVSDTSNLQRMLSDVGGFHLLDAVHVDTLRGAGANYDSVSSLGSLQAGVWFSREGDYRRTPDTQIESLTAEEARTIANGLMKGWKGRPGLTVADSISEFPARLRQAIRDAGAESDMRAVFWNQHVYVLAPRIPNRAALEEVILHEVVGHYGLRKMVGGELKPLLDRVYRDLGDSARARVIKRVYFANNFDATNTEHRLTVAEELLAHLAESGKHQHRTLWQRIVTAIRDGLRRLGFTIQMTENDLLKILEGAQRTVENGGFSRPSDADINFKRVILDLSDSMLTKDGDAARLTNPVTLRDGSRLSGFTDPQTQEVFFGYDQNGEQFTVRRDQVNPDDITSSRDSNRTADALREGLLEAAGSESANPDIRFSRTGNETEAHQRQVKFMDGFATQPLDRMFRALFDVTGMVDSHGRLKKGVEVTRSAERILKEWRPNPNGHFAWSDTILETARHGLLDRYKLTDDYKMAWRQAEAYGRNLDMQTMDILKTLEDRGVSGVEAAVLQKVLTGESVGDHQMQAVAAPIRRAIDDLGQAAVEYGIITREQFERNRGEYLHRSYLRHESEFTGLGKWIHKQQRNQNRKIKGDTAKGRGIEVNVPTSKLMQHVPVGWYGIQKQGQKPDMQALNGQKFVVLENPGVIADRSGTLEGVETAEQPRTTETVYWPASQPVPAKYEAWRKRGAFEVRRSKKDKVVLWRDYTKAEREHMGEILDARFNIAKTFQLLSRDLAMGKFFHDVSLNPEWFTREKPVSDSILSAREANSLHTLSKADWVEVPDTSVSGSAGTRQWGALAGGWVRSEIWRDLNELDKMHNPGMWRKVLTQWKLNKTARSPVVHMNNVMSNLVLMDLADVRVTDLVKGIQSYRARDEHWRAAQEYGAFEGTFINEEIRKQVLDPILDELTKQNLASATDADGTVQSLSRMAYTLWSNIKKLDNAMTQLYQVEDELFRMATYMRRLDLGDTPIDAARTAREQFLDYDIRAPWVNAARRTVLPFISYTYRAVPVVAQSIIHRPWKLAKYFTLAYMANSLSYLLAPGDEDEERRTMRDDQQGMTWIGTPRMLRMPWHDEHGNPVFMDIRRWIPAGDVFDMNQGNSALPIPAPIQFGGPLMLGFEFALNKQAFTGEEIVNRDTDTTGEAVGKTADWLYKSWMPSAAYVPGSYYWEKFWKAEEGARDILGRPYSMSQALLSSVGIKVQPHDVRLGMEFRSRDLASQARTIKADMRRAESDLNRGIINKIEFNKIRSRSREKLERLIEAQKKLTGKE